MHELEEDKVKYNVISLLKTEQLDTKPNMAKFLKQYVQMIRCCNNGKIQFYPAFGYDLSKVFIKFLDGHELVYDMLTDGKFTSKYYYYDDLDEVRLNDKDIIYVEQFFQQLIKFKFVY